MPAMQQLREGAHVGGSLIDQMRLRRAQFPHEIRQEVNGVVVGVRGDTFEQVQHSDGKEPVGVKENSLQLAGRVNKLAKLIL